jgi:hypothetical protein
VRDEHVIADAIEGNACSAGSRGPGGPVRQGAGIAVSGGVGGEGAGSLVEVQMGNEARVQLKGRKGEISRDGQVSGGVAGFHAVVVQRPGGQARQRLRMDQDSAAVERRRRAVGTGRPVLDLGIGRLVRGPCDGRAY